MTPSGSAWLGHAAALLAANGVGRLFQLAYVMVVARALGLEAFGELATVTAYLAILGVLTDFGLSRLVVRDVARAPGLGRGHLVQSLLVRTGLAVLATLVLGAAATFLGTSPAARAAAWVGGLSLVTGAGAVSVVSILSARGRMGRVAVLAALVGALTLVTAWPVLTAGWGVPGLLAALGLVNLAQAALGGWWIRRDALAPGPMPGLSPAALWRFLLLGLPYVGFNLLSIVYLRAAPVLLSLLGGPEPVGLYMAAFRLVEAFALVPLAVVTALFPVMAVQARAGDGSLSRTYGQAIRLLGVLAFPLAAGTTLLATPLVDLVYGPAYRDAGGVLAILVWGLALLYLNAPVGNVILGSDQAARYLPWAALHTLASGLLTGWLAAVSGVRGAAWGFVLAESAGFVLQLWFVRGIVGRLPDFSRLLARPAVAALAMSGVVGGLGLLETSLFLLVPAGVLAYGAALLALGELRAEDRAQVRGWLREVRAGAFAGTAGGGV
jgi:O-antigen/teichoic acid export membrane protein